MGAGVFLIPEFGKVCVLVILACFNLIIFLTDAKIIKAIHINTENLALVCSVLMRFFLLTVLSGLK